MHLLDKQNDIKYVVLFPEKKLKTKNKTTLSAFCLK